MAAAVREHAVARDLLAEGIAEGVVRCEYAGHRCQARIDWINPNIAVGIVDLKTTEEIDSFDLALRALGYIHQLAFYRALVAVASGRALPWFECRCSSDPKRRRRASCVTVHSFQTLPPRCALAFLADRIVL